MPCRLNLGLAHAIYELRTHDNLAIKKPCNMLPCDMIWSGNISYRLTHIRWGLMNCMVMGTVVWKQL